MNMPLVQSWMYLPRFRISCAQRADLRIAAAARRRRSRPWERRTRPPPSGIAPATARSRIDVSYSRMRPQPVQVRLQACSGSSIITSGKRLLIIGCGLRSLCAAGIWVWTMRNGFAASSVAATVLLPLRARTHLVLGDIGRHVGRPAKAELS